VAGKREKGALCMKPYLYALVFGLLGAVYGAPAAAQTDPLTQLCQNFIAQSGTPMTGNSNSLCTCLVGEIQKQLTMTEMQAYQAAAAAGQELAPALQGKVTAIAVHCLSASR
jgi:hypothetical protein